jgi:acetyl-CoA carboxylase biotin carboxylase subunit
MYEGWTVPIDYDALLAKLIGYGTDRQQAIGRLRRALNEYFVGGIKTNISLFRRILNDPDFEAGKTNTGFLDRLLAQPSSGGSGSHRDTEIAAIAAGLFEMLDAEARGTDANGRAAQNGVSASAWKSAARIDPFRPS